MVEDHTPTRIALLRVLRNAGADAVGARDGVEALEYLAAEHFDVMITDMKMPRMDGLELISRCSELPASHQPGRIIVISGQYQATALPGIATADFLAKPIDLQSLLDMLVGMPN